MEDSFNKALTGKSMFSSKHRTKELGKEQPRRCERRNKTLTPKLTESRERHSVGDCFFPPTYQVGNLYPHVLPSFLLIYSITMIFSLQLFIIGRLVSPSGPLVEEDVPTTTCSNYFFHPLPSVANHKAKNHEPDSPK